MNAVEQLLHGHVRDCREKIAAAVSSVDALEKLVGALGQRPAAVPVVRCNGWSQEEEALLQEQYPILGPAGLTTLLPHRTAAAIKAHAHKAGLVFAEHMRRYWCEQCQCKLTSGQVAACQSKFCTAKAVVAAG